MVMAQLMDEEFMALHMEESVVMDLLMAHGFSYRGYGSSYSGRDDSSYSGGYGFLYGGGYGIGRMGMAMRMERA
jgi:hypothetical protein